MMKPPRGKEEVTPGQVITGVILTLLAIPALFVATCLPAALASSVTGSLPVMIVWITLLVAVGIRFAIYTSNPGIRWTIILVLVAGAGFVVWQFLPDWLPGIAWPWH